jgi:hypothetical protein
MQTFPAAVSSLTRGDASASDPKQTFVSAGPHFLAWKTTQPQPDLCKGRWNV